MTEGFAAQPAALLERRASRWRQTPGPNTLADNALDLETVDIEAAMIVHI